MKVHHLLSTRRRLATAMAIAGAGVLVAAPLMLSGVPGVAGADDHGATTVYNSIISPLPGGLASWGFAATGTTEFGNKVVLTRTGTLANVVVTMDSWACQSGSWTGSPSPCVSSRRATYPVPITLSLYKPAATGGVGALIATRTQTFTIPFRPSTNCHQTIGGTTYGGFTSKGTCVFGLLDNITFTLNGVTLTNAAVIYGVSFKTHSTTPTVTTTAVTSLNVALTTTPTDPTVGTNTAEPSVGWDDPGTLYLDSTVYTGGVFKATPHWTVNTTHTTGAPFYLPAVQINMTRVAPPHDHSPHALLPGVAKH